MKRASPQFRASTSDGQVAELFVQLAQLGPLEKYEGSEGNSNVTYTTSGNVITASYAATATFQKGKAEMQIKLIQINGQWFIYGFHIDSPLFAK